jgi:leucyl-tRNA synthetase
MPVDTYTGGAEHATMHLLYTRFFHKAMRDLGVTRGDEPMLQLRNQGQILGTDGQRMSKSRGNVIDPDEQIRAHGADVVRAYLMFGYRWQEGGSYNVENIQGVVRWLHRLWTLVLETGGAKPTAVEPTAGRELRRNLHRAIRQVSDDMEGFEFNTVVSMLMELTNALADARQAGLAGSAEFRQAVETTLLLAAPVVPHIAEELWQRLGKPYSIHQQPWPTFDPAALTVEEITLVIQINGKVRDRIQVPTGVAEDEARRRALASDVVRKHLAGREPRQVVVVPGRVVNIVV